MNATLTKLLAGDFIGRKLKWKYYAPTCFTVSVRVQNKKQPAAKPHENSGKIVAVCAVLILPVALPLACVAAVGCCTDVRHCVNIKSRRTYGGTEKIDRQQLEESRVR